MPRKITPQRDLPPGNIKVTREDWLNVALDVLMSDGVELVKVMVLAERLDVSRSSFYWYFKSRQHLLDALLEVWEGTNTAALVTQSQAPATTITQACCNVFRCVVNPALFNTQLDFAVRDWARKSGSVRRVLDRSDSKRLNALKAMFERFAYTPVEAEARARILYYMQIGYNDADLHEPMEARMRLLPMYLRGFTGLDAEAKDIEDFKTYAIRASEGEIP